MSRKYPVQFEQEDGWTKWIPPRMKGYRMACCDCGLVHDMDFKVVRVLKVRADGMKTVKDAVGPYVVMFRARRNNRSTALKRHHNRKRK